YHEAMRGQMFGFKHHITFIVANTRQSQHAQQREHALPAQPGTENGHGLGQRIAQAIWNNEWHFNESSTWRAPPVRSQARAPRSAARLWFPASRVFESDDESGPSGRCAAPLRLNAWCI